MVWDSNGNKLYKKGDTIFLILSSEGYPRKLGVLDVKHRVMTMTRDSSKHLHIKSNSYGFNFNLLDTASLFDTIRLIIDGVHYMIPISLIKEKGNFLFFRQQGFEKQIFLEVSEILKHESVMDIKINIVEAAALLAEMDVVEACRKVMLDPDDEAKLEELLYDQDVGETLTYKPDYQDLFAGHYDAYFELLMNCKSIESDGSSKN